MRVRRLVSQAAPGHARIREPLVNKTLAAGAVSFPLTAQSATLLKGGNKVLTAGATSFPLVGQSALLRLGRVLTAGVSSYPLTATAATLRKGLTLTAGSRTFPLTVQAATLRMARLIAAGVVSMPLTAQVAALRKGIQVVAGAVSMPLTTQTATLKRGLKVAANAVSMPLTAQAATLTKSASARTFTFIGSCTSTSSSLNFSSLSAGAVAAGDLLVYIDFAIGSGSLPTSVTPSGFTNHIDDPGASTPRGMVSSKNASGSEGSIVGMNGATRNNKIGLVFRPSTSFTTISALDMASDININDPALQTCDPSAETTAVILIGISGIDNATAAFSTFSPAADGTVTNSSSDLLAGYKVYNTSPQSTGIDMNDLGIINWLASLYLKVS